MKRSRLIGIGIAIIASIFLTRAVADVIQNISETQSTQSVPTPIASSNETITATDSPNPTPSAGMSESPLALPSSTAIPRPAISVSDTPTVDTTTTLSLIAPASIAIDPRSHIYLLPHLKLKATTPVLLCFAGHGNTFDIATVEKSDAVKDRSLLFIGEESSRMLVSGSAAALGRFLASTPLWVVSTGSSLSGTYFTVSATALSAPSIDRAFCSHAQTMTSTPFRPLEIELGMATGSGKLK